MAANLTRLIHKIAIKLPTSGREPYHLQFSRQAANPETSGYTLVHLNFSAIFHTLFYNIQFLLQLLLNFSTQQN
jgi:hypothetical protein